MPLIYYSDMTMTSAPLLNTEVRLDKLPPQTCAIVRRIESEHDDVDRLKSLGICVGRRVELVKAGDPLIVRVFGSRLGLSAGLAARVWLEVCPPAHCLMKESSCE
jgi:ferrous iron transport protein A